MSVRAGLPLLTPAAPRQADARRRVSRGRSAGRVVLTIDSSRRAPSASIRRAVIASAEAEQVFTSGVSSSAVGDAATSEATTSGRHVRCTIVWNLAAWRVRRWEIPTNLASPTSTSPGPVPAKQTSADHRVRMQPTTVHSGSWLVLGERRSATTPPPTTSTARRRRSTARRPRGSRDRARRTRRATTARHRRPNAGERPRCPVVPLHRYRRTRLAATSPTPTSAHRRGRTSRPVGPVGSSLAWNAADVARSMCWTRHDGIVSWRARDTASRPPAPG